MIVVFLVFIFEEREYRFFLIIPLILSRLYPFSGSEMVGTAKLRKNEHENKTGEKWEQEDLHLAPYPRSRAYVFTCLSLSCHPHYLRVLNKLSRMVKVYIYTGRRKCFTFVRA